jgi:hypothetical protein
MKEVIKLSDLEFKKAHGGLDTNALKRKNNKNSVIDMKPKKNDGWNQTQKNIAFELAPLEPPKKEKAVITRDTSAVDVWNMSPQTVKTMKLNSAYELAPIAPPRNKNVHMASMRVLPEFQNNVGADIATKRENFSVSPDTAMPHNTSSLYGGDVYYADKESKTKDSSKYNNTKLQGLSRKDTFEEKLDILASPYIGNDTKRNEIDEDFWDVPEIINQQITIDTKDLEERKKEPEILENPSIEPEIYPSPKGDERTEMENFQESSPFSKQNETTKATKVDSL